MAKRRNWFHLLKRFFNPDTYLKQDKKEKRRKWILFGRDKMEAKPSSMTLPSPTRERSGVVEEHSKHALSVALAGAAAAEEPEEAAAVSAADFVWRPGVPEFLDKCERYKEEKLQISIQDSSNYPNCLCKREVQEYAAIKIQTAFRGFLARKALRALKGIVRLQAIIRGHNVRRQAMNTLKCLQSIVNIHSQVCARRTQMAGKTLSCDSDDKKQPQTLKDKIIKMDKNSQRRWDRSILTKEEADALSINKKEAASKRERVREYAVNHRNSAEAERNTSNGRWRYWLDQWVDTQASKSKELEDLDSFLTSSPKPRVEYRGKQLKVKSLHRQFYTRVSECPNPGPRRSFHRRQCSLGEDNPISGSPMVPAYMAATESAKAKARSLSSPRLRPGSFDAYSDGYSPCKNKFTLVNSSGASEVSGNLRYGKLCSYQQRSPSLKGLQVPVISSRNSKDLSFDSECSFKTWHQETSFR